MSGVPKRTPRVGKIDPSDGPGRKANPKHTEIHEKVITVRLTGSKRADLNKVASAMHIAASTHDLVTKGKLNRFVTVTHESTTPKKIFDGLIIPKNPEISID